MNKISAREYVNQAIAANHVPGTPDAIMVADIQNAAKRNQLPNLANSKAMCETNGWVASSHDRLSKEARAEFLNLPTYPSDAAAFVKAIKLDPKTPTYILRDLRDSAEADREPESPDAGVLCVLNNWTNAGEKTTRGFFAPEVRPSLVLIPTVYLPPAV